MSSVDVRLASLASPARARSLLTVRAAISSAVSSDRPSSSSPFLMWSYWRSRFLLHASGMSCSFLLVLHRVRRSDVVGGIELRDDVGVLLIRVGRHLGIIAGYGVGFE